MRFISLAFILCSWLIGIPSLQAKNDEKILVGELVKLSPDQAPVTAYPYYLFIMHEGKAMGVPLDVKSARTANFQHLVGQSIRVSGQFVKRTFDLGEGKKVLDMMVVSELSPISLSALQNKSKNLNEPLMPPPQRAEGAPQNASSRTVQAPTMTLPDQVANGMIVGAGALLIGSMLKDRLKK